LHVTDRTSTDKALTKLNKSWRLADAPTSNKRRLGKFKLVEGVVGCVEGYSCVKAKRYKLGDLGPAFHEVSKSVQERWPHVIQRQSRWSTTSA
jgi:hypothetical protein